MDKVVVLAVAGAVAVGTVLYYLLTSEKPMRTRSRPKDRQSPQPRPRSPPVMYSDVKPKPCRNRQTVPEKYLNKDCKNKQYQTGRSISETSCPLEPEEDSGQKLETLGSTTSINSVPQTIQNNSQSSQDFAQNSYISTKCKACDVNADAIFHPCNHLVFCHDHAEYYVELAKRYGKNALCPLRDDCREIIDSYSKI